MSVVARWPRACLSRLTLPGDIETWRTVEERGAESVVRALPPTADAAPGPGEARAVAEEDIAGVRALGGRFVVPSDGEWPREQLESLRRLAGTSVAGDAGRSPDLGKEGLARLAPPLGLWVRGPTDLGQMVGRAVAVVGSRAATSYGEHVARELCFRLAEEGYCVVSGGAYGIDAAAHRGALAAEGTTVAVLAGGVDVLYPRGNARLLEAVAGAGALVSERPPGSPVGREHFLVRNRLIAALSAGVVVVEAPARSGALATARRAAMMGLPVMAVPGPVTSAVSVGCHLLLREYAAVPVTCAEDVLEVVGPMGSQLTAWPQGPISVRDGLTIEQCRLLDGADPRQPRTLAVLAAQAGITRDDARRCLGPLLARGLLAETAGPESTPGSTPAGYLLTARARDDGTTGVAW